ncbi:MAG: RnfABCDGE type electron transport complex subunit G [Mediterranea sp.]|nr:RnfABCDGE type electron transport complex subunit G [Mediterranea sp.]
MKKLESSLKNMLLVLTGVTAISVALLAYVNELTKEPIAQANAKTLSDAVKAVVPGFDNDPIADKKLQMVNGVEYAVYPASKGGEFIGAAVEAKAMGFGGELRVLVGFDAQGNINDYSLLSHSETPGLGSKAGEWFKKGNKGDITGMNPGAAPLTVSKDGGNVDAITASTITSRAFLGAVNAAYAAYAGNATADGATGATQINVEQPADSVAVQVADTLGLN